MNEDGLPLSVVVGPGNEHDRRRFEAVLEGLRVKKSGRGRGRTRPKVVYADAAYDAKAIREGLRRRGIRAGIPKNPRRGKGTRGGKRAFRRRKADRKARSRCGAVLRMAERGVPKVDGSARKVACHLPGLRPPCRLPHRMENFEMSSRIQGFEAPGPEAGASMIRMIPCTGLGITTNSSGCNTPWGRTIGVWSHSARAISPLCRTTASSCPTILGHTRGIRLWGDDGDERSAGLGVIVSRQADGPPVMALRVARHREPPPSWRCARAQDGESPGAPSSLRRGPGAFCSAMARAPRR
ncbi:transposase [Thermoflexus sp.]|uniref:transposase n=1 Tax=Thermoflexus sp. TaxID=1969742 RepID=UPI00345A30D8